MRPSSSRSEGLLGPVVGSPGPELGDAALLAALLEAEAALTASAAAAGLVEPAAAEAVAGACAAGGFDVDALGEAALGAGNPVVPLVSKLRDAVPAAYAGAVHPGATSQDILDTALVLVARRAAAVLLADARCCADACADVAAAHRTTVLAGRTLLQQAVPTTFGLKAAGWLVGLDAAAADVRRAVEALPAQLGGAAGTLAGYGPAAAAVVEGYAERLGLPAPDLPWHTVRVPMGRLAGALGVLAGVLGKIATDLVLLAQSEVAEVAEPAAPGRGGSSAMPHKRNPVGAVLARADTLRAPGLVATVLLAAAGQEHERAAGGWHAEWQPLRDLLGVTAGAAHHLAGVLPGLTVDAARMRANLDAAHGLPAAEEATNVLAPVLGAARAGEVVTAAADRARADARPLLDVLRADPAVAPHLAGAGRPRTSGSGAPDTGAPSLAAGPGELDKRLEAAFDPAAHLGAAGMLVDRALARHRGER